MKYGWMKPSEMLPAIYGYYFAIVPYTGPLNRKYDLEVLFYDNSGIWWGNKVSYLDKDILAWCDLPDLPDWLEVNE